MRFSEDRMDKLHCADGKTRPIHVWEPASPKAVLLAVHGGLAHAGDYVTPALHFRERGWATVGFDMRGHNGETRVYIDRFEDFLDDLELFVDWVKSSYPGLPIVIMSHSMGSLISTHYALRRLEDEPLIKGFVMSSPYFASAVPVAKPLVLAASILSKITPHLKMPMEDFTHQLTHDEEITRRHIEDADCNIRAKEVSARFGHELINAQRYIPKNLKKWKHPLFAVIAGDDCLSDSPLVLGMLKQVDEKYIETHYYKDNYHENFNEVNRDEIFKLIEAWAKKLITPDVTALSAAS